MRACLGPLPPRRPAVPLPAGAVDTHCHVIGPESRYPFAEGRTYTPPDSTVEDYRRLRETLGIARSVIVQPGAHGFDNQVTLDAVAALGDSARGVVVVPADISDSALQRMHEGGIRGLRLSSLLRGDAGLDGLPRMAERIAPMGWHILIHLKDAAELVDLAPLVRASAVPVVVDHMARSTGAAGPDSPAFRTLIDLMTMYDHVWTKICSWYRLSDREDHADMQVLADQVLAARPDRVLWGTNWPHPLLFDPPMPDDADLAEQFMGWVGPHAQAVLVENPVRLYGF